MLICQPTQTVVYTSDFRDKAYSFIVESVLSQTTIPRQLVISTSADYLVTTSVNNHPQREQLLPYVAETTTSWVARTTVTLWLTATSPCEGNVTIRNSAGETLVLTISTSASPSLLPAPSLTISQPALSFVSATSGKPDFRVLTLTQPHSDKLVTISTDSPEVFQLASDTNPTFSSSLTFIPSPVGTHVHIRYLPGKTGMHKGNVLIQRGDEELNVSLTGRRARRSRLAGTQPAQTRLWIGILTLLMLSGLSLVSYRYRCQLLPGWCPDVAIIPNSVPVRTSLATSRNTLQKPAGTRSASSKKNSPKSERSVAQLASEKKQSTKQDADKPANETLRITAVAPATSAASQQARRQTLPVSPLEESELEKELNRPVQKQL